jgi:hypothetical protein
MCLELSSAKRGREASPTQCLSYSSTPTADSAWRQSLWLLFAKAPDLRGANINLLLVVLLPWTSAQVIRRLFRNIKTGSRAHDTRPPRCRDDGQSRPILKSLLSLQCRDPQSS